MIFFTSDQHWGHARINEFSGRPFTNVPAMNAALVKSWNARVTDVDTVFVLGDVCMGVLSESLGLIRLLAGVKILVPGNHDRVWEGNKKFDGQIERYLDAGFDAIMQPPVPFVLPESGLSVLLSHFPYRGDHTENDRYADRRPMDAGAWLIHGHVHELWRQKGRMINVGVDAWAGKPVSERTIAEMITSAPCDLAPKVWQTS